MQNEEAIVVLIQNLVVLQYFQKRMTIEIYLDDESRIYVDIHEIFDT